MNRPTIAVESTPEDCITVHDMWSALVFVVMGTLVLLLGAFWGLPFGKSICGVLRVLEGQVPYRDFWIMYAPGQFYAIAGLFWIFGSECLVQGITVILINGTIGGGLFIVARRAGVKCSMAIIISFIIVASFWRSSPELTTWKQNFAKKLSCELGVGYGQVRD